MAGTVEVFDNSNFGGSNKAILKTGEHPTIPIGNDKIASIKITEGSYAQFFLSTGFQGRSMFLFAGEYKSIPDWTDRIGSAKVFEYDKDLFPLVKFYEHSNFGGHVQTLAGTGETTDYEEPFLRHDAISSVKVPPATTVILFENGGLGGRKLVLREGEHNNLGVYGFDNKASSVQIQRDGLVLVGARFMKQVINDNGDPIAIRSVTVNNSDVEQSFSVLLSKELSQSVTRSWSKSTLLGVSISQTSTATVNSGVVEASVSATIEATLENTFTIGEDETKSKSISFEKSLSVNVPAKMVGEACAMLTPKKFTATILYTFLVEATGQTVTQEAAISVDAYEEALAFVELRPIVDGDLPTA